MPEKKVKVIRSKSDIIKIYNSNIQFYATFHGEGTRLINEEQNEQDFRTDFQHDRDRIIHSRAFRRLKHKTQVFLSIEGDHFRTRLTHTLEVAQISRTIARSLGLNEDLCEAIALGHDLGHTPFGHIGENFLNQVMSGIDTLDKLIPEKIKFQLGGFKHNYQSLKVVDSLEKRYNFEGLNLTDKVRLGILKHTSLKTSINYHDLNLDSIDLETPLFLEAQVVAFSDEIAQQTHDLEDGLRSHIVNPNDVLKLDILKDFKPDKCEDDFIRNHISRFLINKLVSNAVLTTGKNIETFIEDLKIYNHDDFLNKWKQKGKNLVSFSNNIIAQYKELRSYVYQEIINSAQINRLEGKAKFFLRKLFKAYVQNPLQLPDYMLNRYARLNGETSLRKQPFELREKLIYQYRQRPDFIRLICDYIAGMTDSFAIEEFKKLYLP